MRSSHRPVTFLVCRINQDARAEFWRSADGRHRRHAAQSNVDGAWNTDLDTATRYETLIAARQIVEHVDTTAYTLRLDLARALVRRGHEDERWGLNQATRSA